MLRRGDDAGADILADDGEKLIQQGVGIRLLVDDAAIGGLRRLIRAQLIRCAQALRQRLLHELPYRVHGPVHAPPVRGLIEVNERAVAVRAEHQRLALHEFHRYYF